MRIGLAHRDSACGLCATSVQDHQAMDAGGRDDRNAGQMTKFFVVSAGCWLK
jgi:hypothetical protein